MQPSPTKILLIEDNPGDARLIEIMLSELENMTFSLEATDRLAKGIERLKRGDIDLILLDLTLPDSSGLETFSKIQELTLDVPVIVLTGLNNEAIADQAAQEGAQDYLVKGEFDGNLLARACRYALARHRTEQALRTSEERYALALQAANDGIWDWNLRTDQIYFSDRWKSILGYKDHEVGNQPEDWDSRVYQEDLKVLKLHVQSHLQGESPHFQCDIRMRHKDGTYRWVTARGLAVRDEAGQPYRMAGSISDITDRKRVEEQLLRDAFYDGYTGLPNRALFLDRLDRLVRRKKGSDEIPFTVLYLDIDRFKVINDTFGHRRGDEFLLAFTKRLTSLVENADTIARIGGDEFAILLEDTESLRKAVEIAHHVLKILERPFQIGGQKLFASMSIGIVPDDPDYEQAEDVLRDAEIAMYRAKANGKGQYVIFNSVMHTNIVEHYQKEIELRRGVEQGQFFLVYQPIVSLRTERISGFEALIRWKHPEQGLVYPGDFIKVAEETGLIIPIGNWVLGEACRQLQSWQTRYPQSQTLTMSVNLSSKQFFQNDLVEQIVEVLQATGVNGECLRLEITESALMKLSAPTINTLHRLQAIGVQLQIDDFGTGYSSLSYLHQLPIDAIKIDRSFINIDSQGTNAEIVRTIVKLSQDLGMAAIAEGVETVEQLAKLKALNCDFGQGYHFARPLDPVAATRMLSEDLADGDKREPQQGIIFKMAQKWGGR